MDFDQLNTFIESCKAGQLLARSRESPAARNLRSARRYGSLSRSMATNSWIGPPGLSGSLPRAKSFLNTQMNSCLGSKSLQAVSQQNGIPAGTLSIGANEGTFLYVLPKVFAKYHRAFPKVRSAFTVASLTKLSPRWRTPPLTWES